MLITALLPQLLSARIWPAPNSIAVVWCGQVVTQGKIARTFVEPHMPFFFFFSSKARLDKSWERVRNLERTHDLQS